MVLLPGTFVMATACGETQQSWVSPRLLGSQVSAVPVVTPKWLLLPQHFSVSSSSTAHVRWLPRATCLTLFEPLPS